MNDSKPIALQGTAKVIVGVTGICIAAVTGISIAKIQAELETKYAQKRIFMTFYMPMIVLAIRMEVEVIFKNSYPEFFSDDTQEKIAMKLINDLITQIIDPNIFYSRFSFFESGRDAINLKYSVS